MLRIRYASFGQLLESSGEALDWIVLVTSKYSTEYTDWLVMAIGTVLGFVRDTASSVRAGVAPYSDPGVGLAA
jgi:hypothetical protein